MKRLLLILLCLPMIGFSQTDLTPLLFQLIDSKDSRTLLENQEWHTNSINKQEDEYGISFNEFVLSKDVDFSEGNSSRCYLTINEYSSSSNIIILKLDNKDFYNQFKQIIVNSAYKKISQDVEYNTIEETYKKNPLHITFKEELNNHYQITLFNNRDKQKRYKSIKNKNRLGQRCITGNCNTGYGTKTYDSGSKYAGEWKDSKWHGQGTYTYENIPTGKGTTWGGIYIGYWKYGRRNGFGTNTYTNAGKYVGEYKNDKYHGQGTRTYPSGSKYVGEFRDDKYNGQGTMTWASGHKYVGGYKDNKRNGQGTMTYPLGSKYVGEWKYGDQNGLGTYTHSDGRVQKGLFENGNFLGE